MNIEENIFKRAIIDFDKLSAYGFTPKQDLWTYTQTFMNNEFKAVVTINNQGQIRGNVYETDSNEPYIPLRVEGMNDGYVGEVRSEYKKILSAIKEHCCHLQYFISPQANHLAEALYQKYGDRPTFPWEKYSGHGVFRNPHNQKWYALIMSIDKSKLNKSQSGEVEVINLKISEQKIPELLKQKGFFPAYHMNKKTWITLILNDTLPDALILSLIEESHAYTIQSSASRKLGPQSWLIPANPSYFDLKAAFAQQDEIIWKQNARITMGDTVYLYLAAPISAIIYQCAVTKTDIPYNYEDKNLKITKVMKIKRLQTYPKDFMPLSRLKQYGIKAIRNQQICPDELASFLSTPSTSEKASKPAEA